MSALPSVQDTAPELFSISTDKARLDVPWVVHSILGSYWGSNLSGGMIREALNNSLVFGAYLAPHPAEKYSLAKELGGDAPRRPPGQQVGVVRVITDGAIFSSVTDVFVQTEWRGKGVGTALMKVAVEHPSVAGTLCILKSRPEAYLWYYGNFDFRLLDRKHGLMQRQPR